MSRKVKYDFNPFALTGESAAGIEDKEALLEKIADLVTETVKERAVTGLSTVSGRGKWAKLSKDYAASRKGGNRTANLTLEGDMLGSFGTTKLSGNILRTSLPDDEQGKADGHNNFSGASQLPERRFVPDAQEGETWNRALIQAMAKMIRDAKE
jgi:hypothetical protein